MDSNDIRILIANDHALFRAAFRKLLQTETGVQVIGEACNTSELIQQVNRLKPHIVLLDLGTTPESLIQALRRLAACSVETRTIAYTAVIDPKLIIKAILLGARGVVPWSISPPLVAKSIHSVMAGELWIPRKVTADLVSAFRNAETLLEKARAESFGLTQRETEIALAVADGCTNKDAAEKLSLREQTVKNYMRRIFTKLGVSGRQELAVFTMDKIIAA